MASIDELKQKLRSKMKSLLNNKSETWLAVESEKASRNLVKTLQELKAHSVGIYSPLAGEVDWQGCLDQFHEVMAFPKACGAEQMQFYSSRPEELEVSRDFGVPIKTPLERKPVVPDVLIVPGLAFSSDGKRLGRGRGFYDRYLEAFTGVTLGVCFEEQIVNDIPTDEYDQKVSQVLTNRKIYAFNKGTKS